MRIDRAGLPFIAAPLVPAVLFFALGYPVWGAVLLACAAFMTFFFRDPERRAPEGDNLVLAPADGRVMAAGLSDPAAGPPGTWQQITIFLSPMDVHMNRSPVTGQVMRIEYRPGKFLPAYKEDAGENELNEIWIDHNGEPIVVRQIVGILARRIVCRVVEGQTLARGERIGLMKFGSRMDVFLPSRAQILVQVGQHVVGGETVLARLDSPAGNSA